MKRFLLAALMVIFAAQAPLAADLATMAPLSVIKRADIADTLQAAKGKTVLINFFASWCPPCREEIPDLIKIRKDVGSDKLVMIGISVDDNPGDLKKMADKFPFNYPVFLAGPGVAQAFQVQSIPLNIVYGPDGSVVFAESGMIDYDTVKHILKQVERP